MCNEALHHHFYVLIIISYFVNIEIILASCLKITQSCFWMAIFISFKIMKVSLGFQVGAFKHETISEIRFSDKEKNNSF